MVARSHPGGRRLDSACSETGQAVVLFVLLLSIFLIAVMAFAIDYTNLLFHRQATQAAADAACEAGAMDMLVSLQGTSLPNMGFTAGTASDCVASSSATMCSYAGFNGYDGSGLNGNSTSNAVSWTFPTSVSGVNGAPSSLTSFPFLKVTVSENVKSYFASLITGNAYQQVGASSTCGLVQTDSTAPIVVLHPTMSGAFHYEGGALLSIAGGPQRSLQVNSSSTTAITYGPTALIDTSKGGPNGTGSDVATFGGPAVAPPGFFSFNPGTTGNWVQPASPILDPYSGVPSPAWARSQTPVTGTGGTKVLHGVDGCPDNHPSNYPPGCVEFGPGYYPSGISQGANDVLIFLPGVYYMNGSLNVGGSDIIRMAKPCTPTCGPYTSTAWQQTDGVMFYFFSGSLNINGGSGAAQVPRVDPVSSSDLTCDGSVPNANLGLPTQINNNVMVSQCTANGTYWDSGNDTTDSRGSPGSRGLLVFQDHGNRTAPGFGGSGSLVFSGTFYFHSTSYQDVFSVVGGSSSGTFVLGGIIADQISLTGSGKLSLSLNPAASVTTLKVGIVK